MRKLEMIAAVALGALAAAPASAQLLGGGNGLGGLVGGTLGHATGTLSGAGSMSKSGSIRADKSVDRRSGRVAGSASGNGSMSGQGSAHAGLLGHTLGGAGAGSATGSGGGSAEAQLIGTDSVHGALANTRGKVGGLASQAGQAATGLAGQAGSAAGAAQGLGSGMLMGSGAGQGSGSAGAGGVMGSAMGGGDVAKSLAIAPGTLIEDSRGRVIGAVQEVRTNAKGAVQAVLVRVGEAQALVPVGNFHVSGDGSALVSAMGKGQLQKTAARQEKTPESTAPASAPQS